MSGSEHIYRVAILGAGMSGICMGATLRRAGNADFVILEKAASVGGTWRENTYPGVACDVPSHVYSFSFDLNPEWSQAFSPGQEIYDYCKRCVARFGLEPHIRFGQEVLEVAFVDGLWQVTLRGGERVRAHAVVSGLGGLHVPNRASIAGLDSFAGQRFHTAQWDHEHSLKGKHVAVIGTGATAAQVLPAIAPDVASVTVFQRHAAWVFPRMASAISESTRERFRRSPWRMRLYRWFLWAFMDVMGILSLARGGWFNQRMRQGALAYLDAAVRNPVLRKQLTPNYEAGCKRRVVSDDYLQAFNRDNVHLVTDRVAQVTAAGVVDASGTLHEVDTIIEATGFKPFDITDYVQISGRDGQRLQDVWREHVQSFRTLMVPGFPNFFLLLGPNSATGHTSALIMIESQARFALQCLQMLERDGLRHLDPLPEATEGFNRRVQRDMSRMVFSGGCESWYTDEHDYNFTLWPYSAFRFVFELARPLRREFRAD